MEWSSLLINRAEPLMLDGSRPNAPFIHTRNKFITVWPVKLAFAPLVAKKVEQHIRDLDIEPCFSKSSTGLPKPVLSNLPWDELISWT